MKNKMLTALLFFVTTALVLIFLGGLADLESKAKPSSRLQQK
jgi:hypothetical protein